MGVRVLVIDDQPQLRVLVRRFFAIEGDGLEVVAEAASAEEAITTAGDVPADVAIVDANLPDGDGVELAAALRALQPGLRIVLFTGHVDAAIREQAASAGIDAVVTKDAVADLARAVAEVAGR